MEKRNGINFRPRMNARLSRIFNILVAAVILVLCNVMLEYSTFFLHQRTEEHFQILGIEYFMLGTVTLGILLVIFYILCNRIWLASLLCAVVCGIIAIINYYVVKFHGAPLSFLNIKNFATALDVIDGYNLTLDRCVILILRYLIGAVLLCSLAGWFTQSSVPSGKRRVLRDIAFCLIGCIMFYVGYLGEQPIKPAKTIGWLWVDAYSQYGYVPCTVETYYQMKNAVSEPEGYSGNALEEIEITQISDEQTASPDIVLILNETFYDLGQIADVETDVPYLENIDNLENCLRGYAVVPGAAGGTNSSEYELLTSNSLQLMPGITPFNVLDLHNANSVVAHMNALGYDTTGSHSEPAENYNRGVGYNALAFHNVHFEEDFLDTEYYYERWFKMDKSVYKNLIRWYEEEAEDTPRFQYLLTIQNHGSWDMNDSQYDTVHAVNDFGEYDGMVDEFLTCISQSDQAFKELTDYFSQVDRPVIVCMLGDHAPSFAASIVDEKYSNDERNLLLRKVPLLIWANYELEEDGLGTMSLNYVVPTLLDLAGVKLSPYYSYMLQLKHDVPILTSYGSYFDAEGNRYTYDTDTGMEYEKIVDNYFYLEYNNLSSNRKQELFTPDHS